LSIDTMPKKLRNFRDLRAFWHFTAIYPLAGCELAKSTAYQEHRKPLAKPGSRKPWNSGIFSD
jgi:hypothetical protein